VFEGIPCKSALETEIAYDSSGRIFKRVSDPEIWYYPSTVKTKKENNPAVLVIPGGSYWGLWFDKEGVDVAKWLNKNGVSAFVLKHRLPHWESKNCRSKVALMDAQRSIRIIRNNSKRWGLNPEKIGVLGFSAGGHLASTLSTHHDAGLDLSNLEIEKISSRPDFTILIYPVITMNRPYAHSGSRENLLGKIPAKEYVDYFSNDLQVRSDTPPAILIHSDDDEAVPSENSIQYYFS
jgi:acetyl esterase/lipase